MQGISVGPGRLCEGQGQMTHRRAAPSESVYVLLHDIWVNTSLLHALLEERSDVDTLTTGQNLLAAEEEIIGVGEFLA